MESKSVKREHKFSPPTKATWPFIRDQYYLLMELYKLNGISMVTVILWGKYESKLNALIGDFKN